eukprot:7966532-Alexandrium_andersonii.AAC.1
MALLGSPDGLMGADGRRLHEHVYAGLPLNRTQHVLQARLGVAAKVELGVAEVVQPLRRRGHGVGVCGA